MFKINEYVLYKRDVCKVIDIKENYYKNNDYYELMPVNDESLKIVVPMNSNLLKKLISVSEVEELINKIPSIPIIECDTKLIENEYKNLLKSESYEDLIRIIKTTYLRNKDRVDNHKKIGDKDNYYFLRAENYLYSELAIVLNMSIEDTKEYIIKRVNELEK